MYDYNREAVKSSYLNEGKLSHAGGEMGYIGDILSLTDRLDKVVTILQESNYIMVQAETKVQGSYPISDENEKVYAQNSLHLLVTRLETLVSVNYDLSSRINRLL